MRSSANPTLSEAAYAVLRGVTIEAMVQVFDAAPREYHIKLNSGELSRDLYEEVNEVLTRLGGKWKGGKTAFARDKDKLSRRSGFHMGANCYFLVPPGLITAEEAPSYWGVGQAVAKCDEA